MPPRKRKAPKTESGSEDKIPPPIPVLRPPLHRTPADPAEAQKGIFYGLDEDPENVAPERRRLALQFSEGVDYTTPPDQPLRYKSGYLAKMMTVGRPFSNAPVGYRGPPHDPDGSPSSNFLMGLPGNIRDAIIGPLVDYRPIKFILPAYQQPGGWPNNMPQGRGSDWIYPDDQANEKGLTNWNSRFYIDPSRFNIFRVSRLIYFEAARRFYLQNNFEIEVAYWWDLHDPLNRVSLEFQLYVKNLTIVHVFLEHPCWQAALQKWYHDYWKRYGTPKRPPVAYQVREFLPGPVGGATGAPRMRTLELVRNCVNFKPLCAEWIEILARCTSLERRLSIYQLDVPGNRPHPEEWLKPLKTWFQSPNRTMRGRAEIIWRKPLIDTAKVYWEATNNTTVVAQAFTRFVSQCPDLLGTHPANVPTCNIENYLDNIFSADYTPQLGQTRLVGRGSRAFYLPPVTF